MRPNIMWNGRVHIYGISELFYNYQKLKDFVIKKIRIKLSNHFGSFIIIIFFIIYKIWVY